VAVVAGQGLPELVAGAAVQWGQIPGGDSKLSWEVTVAGLYCTKYYNVLYCTVHIIHIPVQLYCIVLCTIQPGR